MAAGLSVGTAYVDIKPDMSKFSSGVSSGLKSHLAAFAGAASRVAKITGVALVAGFGAATIAGIKFDSQLQQAQISFTTLLGSGKKAKVFLDDLQQFAAKTPFNFDELIPAAQRMLAFGFTAKDVIPILTNVGNAVSALGGTTDDVNGITFALGQLKSRGKADLQDLYQISNRGIPIFQALADHLHESTSQVMTDITAGKVSFKQVMDAFNGYSKSHYGDAMAKQSRTFAGALSNLHDVAQMTIGKALQPLFKWLSNVALELGDFTQTDTFHRWVTSFQNGIADAIKSLQRLAGWIGSIINAPSWHIRLDIVWEGLKDAASALWDGIKHALLGYVESQKIELPTGKIIGTKNIVHGGLVGQIASAFKGVDWGAVGVEIISGIVGAISKGDSLAHKMVAAFVTVLGDIPWFTIGKDAAGFMVQFVNGLLTELLDPAFWLGHWEDIFGIALAIIPGDVIAERLGLKFIRIFTKPLADVERFIIRWIKTGFVDSFKFGESEFGRILTSLFGWLKRAPGRVKSGMENVLISVGQALGSIVRIGLSYVGRILKALLDPYVNLGGKVLSRIRSLGSTLSDYLGGLIGTMASKAASIGTAIMQGIANGLSSLKDWLFGQIGNIASGLLDHAKNILHINSPSKVFSKIVGGGIMEGIAEGVNENQHLPQNAITEAVYPSVPFLSKDGGMIGKAITPTIVAAEGRHTMPDNMKATIVLDDGTQLSGYVRYHAQHEVDRSDRYSRVNNRMSR